MPWLLLACITVLVWGPWCVNRWRFRQIPGPFAPPVIGNLMSLMDINGFFEHCRSKYGKVFKIYVGPSLVVCVADPVLAKRMLSKLSFRHTGISLTAGPSDWNFLGDGLVGANGPTWRTLRSAWQPAFSPSALSSYLPATRAALDRLCGRLDVAAASGEVVELSGELTRLTLDMVGHAAYGVDLHLLQQQLASSTSTTNSSSSSSSSDGNLLPAMQAVFDGGGVANSSAYMAAVLLFPGLTRMWQWLAYHFPDRTLRKLAHARQRIRQVSLHLLHSWHPTTTTSSSSSSSDSKQREHGGLEDTQAAAAVGGCRQGVQQGAQPGVFPQTLLQARDKETGEPLSDEQVVSQLNTFLLAAFETTAAAIAFAVYFIAQHPQVEERLLQELAAHHQQQQGHQQQQQQQQLDLTQLPYTEAVVQEALRLLPPGSLATRCTEQQGLSLAVSDTQQVWVPPHTPVFGCIHSFQRDPDYWPHALEFRPVRWLPEGTPLQPATPDAYMPFGAGGRMCVGKQFAHQALLASVSGLVRRYTISLEPGQVPLPVKQTFALVPAKGLRVRLSRRL